MLWDKNLMLWDKNPNTYSKFAHLIFQILVSGHALGQTYSALRQATGVNSVMGSSPIRLTEAKQKKENS